MTDELIILGTGGNAHDVLDIVEAQPSWHVAGFLDDSKPIGSKHLGFPILGRIADALDYRRRGQWFVNAIGSDQTFRRRAEIIESTRLLRENFATLIHPTATISTRATIGRGCIVGPHANIGGAVKIGDHVIVCPGVIVGHDGVIRDHAILAPACCIGGSVQVGESCYIGSGAMLHPRVRLAPQTLVGMGAVVLHGTREAQTLVGNPARSLEVSCPDQLAHANSVD